MEMDEWEGKSASSHVIQDPTEEEIMSGIRSLDAVKKTLLTLSAPNSAYVTIAGGLNGQFVVAYGDAGGTPSSVIGSSPAGRYVEMFVGGQQSEFQSDNIVDAETAFFAAMHFAKTGQMNPALMWRED